MHISEALHRPANTKQEIFDVVDGRIKRRLLPPPECEVALGVSWGLAECPFTPAFWAAQTWFDRDLNLNSEFRWGSTLTDEVVGCLLGGHGIKWEMNHAAFTRLKEAGVVVPKPVALSTIVELLSVPFEVDGRSVRYRFPRQKGIFVADAINRLAVELPATRQGDKFREWLLGFRGIGPKTASWITRNHLNSSRMAIIDIHVFRACMLMGIFKGTEDLTRDYFKLETRYLALADALGTDAQRLDAVIWKTMRTARVSIPELRRAA